MHNIDYSIIISHYSYILLLVKIPLLLILPYKFDLSMIDHYNLLWE